jgi:CRP/FNR family cyclic AMP-dependent transcriptional regulator
MNKFGNILKQADIFDQFTQSQIDLVAVICKERSCASGEIIVQEGSSSDDLYIIADGEVDVQVNPGLVSKDPSLNQELATIATLRRGQSFGEIALVDQGLRSATVRAGENGARVIKIERDHLIQLCEQYPQLGFRLMYNLAADLALKIRAAGIEIRGGLLADNS